jgi:hypothetical protein
VYQPPVVCTIPLRVNVHEVVVIGFSGGQTRLESENTVAGHGLELETSARAVHCSGGEKTGGCLIGGHRHPAIELWLAHNYTWLAPTLR